VGRAARVPSARPLPRTCPLKQKSRDDDDEPASPPGSTRRRLNKTSLSPNPNRLVRNAVLCTSHSRHVRPASRTALFSFATPWPLALSAPPLLGVPLPSRPIGTADSPPVRPRHSGGRSHRSNSRTRSSFRQAASSRPRRCFHVPALGGKSLRGFAAPPFLPEEIVLTRSVGCVVDGVVKEVAL